MKFVDETVLSVKAGKGGDGCVGFRREPYTPMGGPDGGDGGRGGSVILVASRSLRDLTELSLHPHQRAESGGPGSGNNRHGADGRDLVIQVPDGTVVADERGPVADLVGEGTRVVIAAGGSGGRGNAALASPKNKAPRRAEPGEPGEEHRVSLELRLVADVALVGLPSAGKSTLLSCLTAARPKVAAYPFTTLSPNLGVTEGDERIVVADVPGLIEGAHEGRGLGDRFLRHITRCRALVMVVDASTDDPVADLRTVRAELIAYDPRLGDRPWIVALTKVDLLEERLEGVVASVSAAASRAMPVSGVTRQGISELNAAIEKLVLSLGPEVREPFVVLRPGRPSFTVERDGSRFRVSGRSVERWVEETDLDDPSQVATLQKRFVKEGIEKELATLGARAGDEVLIGESVFEFFPEGGSDGSQG
jgi:GTP-binding protein